MGRSCVPRILEPNFTWRRPTQRPISQTTPSVPPVPGRTKRLVWGFIHRMLYPISMKYCSWFNVPFESSMMQLPFGLVMKWTDRTTLEEAIAMKMAEAGGIPVPQPICCGEHPNDPVFRFSILMPRLPGFTLSNSRDPLEIETEGPWLSELELCVRSMRLWCPPDENRISSVIGTAIRSQRVPGHFMGPFADQDEFYKFLLAPASTQGFQSRAEYEETLSRARELQQSNHRIMFTHGDFKAHNILIDEDGHLSGFLDWESGGWCPEYWEFTTAMRFGRDSWWFQVAAWMGGNKYLHELDSDRALNKLTVDSYIGW